MKDTQVSFRSNTDLVKKAREVFGAHGMDMSSALNQFLSRSVEENALPFSCFDEGGEKVFAELKAEMETVYQSYKNGNYVSASEVERKWGV